MSITTRLCLPALLVAGFFSEAAAQTAADTPQLNRAVLRHFESSRLEDLIQNQPDRLEKVMYYFTASFQVTMAHCSTCPVDYDQFYNSDLFNVYDYESQRSQAQPVVINHRGLYTVTLASLADVAENLDGISVFELLKGLPYRELPAWTPTGNDDADFANYKLQLLEWKTDFPQEFAQLKHSPTLLIIRFAQFREMSIQQRTLLMAQSSQYLLADDEVMGY